MILSFLLLRADAFYLPGIAPIDYEKGSSLDVKVNVSTSVYTIKCFFHHDSQETYIWLEILFCCSCYVRVVVCLMWNFLRIGVRLLEMV